MESVQRTRSPFLAVAVAIAAYIIASLARDQLLPVSESTLGRTLDVSLLYTVILLPGVIVGWMLRRGVLEWGFLAGLLSESLRQGLGAVLAWSQLPSGSEVVGPGAAHIAAMVYTSLPSAVIGAAGGAVGLVLAKRAGRSAAT
jgi:hypothetical protein